MKKVSVTVPAVLLLACVLSACVMMVLLMGARSYQGTADRDASILDGRTLEQYLTAKLRRQDSAGMNPSVTDMDGNQVQSGGVLRCPENDGGTACVTIIYCFDGKVYELYTLSDLSWEPGDGEQILEAQSLSFEDTGCGIRVMAVMPDGKLRDFYVGYLSAEEGGGSDESE